MRTPHAWRLLPLLLSILILAACGEITPTPTPLPPAGTVITTVQGQYRNITSADLAAWMTHKDFFLVDVHVPHEGQMPNLDARIAYDQIAAHLDQLPANKAANIVLTCKSGSMSAQAATTLADLGYTNVYNLAGGFVGWRDQGYPLTPEP